MAEKFWNSTYAQLPIQTELLSSHAMVSTLSHFGDIRGKQLLDLGCGLGEASLTFAALGAEVTALDASQVSIDRLTQHCRQHGIAGITPRCASAFDIGQLPPFDLIYGKFILHHLEPFADFAPLLARSLLPGGKAFFFENNPGIGAAALWFRSHLAGRLWFPKYGDDEEFPLTRAEVELLRQYLSVQVVYPELLLFRKISQHIFHWKVFPGAFQWLDHFGYRFPGVRALSYHQYLLLISRQPPAKSG